MRHERSTRAQVLASGMEVALGPVFAGDRVDFLAELLGGTVVDFCREPTVRTEVWREGRPWQVVPLERVHEDEAVRYRSHLVTLPSAGAYTVIFRAEGNATAEVWNDRLISTRSVRESPEQIVYPGKLTVSPVPWSPGRIIMYASLAGTALGVVFAAGMAVIGQYVRSPLRR